MGGEGGVGRWFPGSNRSDSSMTLNLETALQDQKYCPLVGGFIFQSGHR